MMAAGLAAVDRSKKHGLWDSTAAVDALLVPDDLRSGMRADGSAEAFFDAAAPSYRRNVLRWISQAKTSETRARRIATTIDRSTKGEKIPQM